MELPQAITNDDLAKIEAEMKKIIKEDIEIERFELPVAEALALMKGQDYKEELIREHAAEGEHISFYKQGDFTDLCAGPHLMRTGNVKAVKLTSITGAYWRGDASNKMLQRLYGIAFPKQSLLEEHLTMMEEAKKRDHNKLGRELELFTTSDVIGQGLPILLPKGARIVQLLQRFVEDEEQRRGWLLTKTPFMAKSDLYKISGHWDHYKDGMFVLGDEEKDKEVFALRPMTCPFQYQAYLNRKRSYRDLPLRYNETSTLFRVRQFTISEGHLMCTPEQLEDEFRKCLELAIFMLKTLGLYEDVSYRFSQWDPNDREKYIGTEEQWNEAQGLMERILNHLEIPYEIGIGEAAFYGPKLIEKYAGAFPLWLAPVQVKLLPIADRHLDYLYEVKKQLEDKGFRCEVDDRSEKIGYKIREAQLEKVPYMVVVGDKDIENNTISIRKRKEGDLGAMTVEQFLEKIVPDRDNKVID